MEYFIEINLQRNKELRPNILLNNVYTNLHQRLYDMNCKTVGVSFPNFRVILGNKLRIHGNLNDLNEIQSVDWLGNIKQYCVVSGIEPIPENVQYRTMSRIQSTMSQSKLRRLIKRGTILEEDVKKYKVQMLQKGLGNPYVELVSASNGKLHRRYFQFGELQHKNVSGEFDFFGLSKTATVPWF